MKSTNSRLFEVTELENRSNSVLEEINASNVENAKKIDFIEEFEATTEQKISGQESEIRILSKMLNSKFTHDQSFLERRKFSLPSMGPRMSGTRARLSWTSAVKRTAFQMKIQVFKTN